MEHFLIALFAEIVPRMDRVFQRPLRKEIAELEALLVDAADVLRGTEICIRPLRRYLLAALITFAPATMLCCGVFLDMVESDHQPPQNVRRTRTLGLLAAWTIVGLTGTALVERVMRGATMILRPGGLVIRRRGTSVFMPWRAFELARHLQITPDWWFLPVAPEVKEQILQSRNGYLVARGGAVSTSQLYFRRKGDAVLPNLFTVHFDELQRLLANLGPRLANQPTKAFPMEVGEPVAEEFV